MHNVKFSRGVFYVRSAEYKKCGLENEQIEGWGHDDAERIKRLTKLGYPVSRIHGPLYHAISGMSAKKTHISLIEMMRIIEMDVKAWTQLASAGEIDHPAPV